MDNKQSILVEDITDTADWNEVSDVLRTAHADNVRRGIVMRYPHLSPVEMREKILSYGGRLFAVKDSGRIVATGAVAIRDMKFWCGIGKYGYFFLASVLPDFSGRGLHRAISDKVQQYVKDSGVDRIYFDTHIDNKRIQKVSKKDGYRRVTFRVNNNHASVIMVKWFSKPPYSKLYCELKFQQMRHIQLKKNKGLLV